MLAATVVYSLAILQPWESYLREKAFNARISARNPIGAYVSVFPPSLNPNTDKEILNSPDPAKYLPKLPGWDYDKETKRFFRTNTSRKDIQEKAKVESYEDSVNSLLQ